METLIKQSNLKAGSISTISNIGFNVLIIVFSLLCVLPFVLVVIISLTNEEYIAVNGFSFFPKVFSLYAYKYIFTDATQILNSLSVSVFVTIVGTLVTLIITTMYAYVLFRKDFKYRNFFSFLAFFTMLFSGGLVPYYIVCTQILHLKDTLGALILPACLNAFNIIVLRTFFQTSISDSIIEAAEIDGAGEFRTLIQIVFPVSLPGIATIGLFSCLAYWNDWFTPMLFIQRNELFPLQYLMQSMVENMDYLSKLASSAEVNEARKLIPKESASMAVVVISTIPIAFAYPFFQRYFISGLQLGSVKG